MTTLLQYFKGEINGIIVSNQNYILYELNRPTVP